VSNATLTTHGPAATTWWNKLLLGVALLIGLIFVIGFVFPYLSLNPAVFVPYVAKKGWLLTHITAGTVALILGPFVLGMGLNRRRMQLHRRLGFAYMTSIALSSAAAFYLASHTDVSWVFGMGLTGLGLAWITTTGMAFLSIQRRLIMQHKEWMIRSYVVTFAFVNFRILAGVLEAAGVGTLVERLNAASWFCWAFPLLVTELLLQGKKIFEAPVRQ
jgi:Predicted membrane protein (DUF2306)